MTQAWGSEVNPPAPTPAPYSFLTHTHKCSLLFSFLIAWELAAGSQTSHQNRGER